MSSSRSASTNVSSRGVDRARLGRKWRSDPPPAKLRAIGDAWIAGKSSVVLQVPSVLVPAEFNYLVNPRHADFANLHTCMG